MRKWTKEKVQQEALKHNTRIDFKNSNEAAYRASIKLGIADDVCSHMNIRVRWCKKTIRKAALPYTLREEFKRRKKGAYKAAMRLNILDDVCSHMIKPKCIKHNIIYMWSSIEYPYVWKIGISSSDAFDKRISTVSCGSRLTVNELYYIETASPIILERILLKTGKRFNFGRKFDGYTEFRILNEEELFHAKEIFGVGCLRRHPKKLLDKLKK